MPLESFFEDAFPFYTSYKGWKLVRNCQCCRSLYPFYTSYKGWKLCYGCVVFRNGRSFYTSYKGWKHLPESA